VRGQHRIAGPDRANGDGDRLGQPLRIAIGADGARRQAEQCGGFGRAEAELRFECDQIRSAHGSLLVGHDLERIGSVVEAILPFDPAAKVCNVYLAECSRLIEEDPEMSGPMDEPS
jgi:hypothetical protein